MKLKYIDNAAVRAGLGQTRLIYRPEMAVAARKLRQTGNHAIIDGNSGRLKREIKSREFEGCTVRFRGLCSIEGTEMRRNIILFLAALCFGS